MEKMRQLGALTVVAVLAIVAGGWFLLVSPQRSKVGDLHAQAADQQQKNMQLSTQIARLKAEARDLPAEQARLAAIAEQLPPNPSMPTLVNGLARAAKRAGVDLQIIAPQPPTPYGGSTSVQLLGTAPATGVLGGTSTTSTSTTSTSSGTTSSSTTSSSTTSSSTTSTGSSTTTPTTSTGAATLTGTGLIPAGGLYQIPMSVTVVGTYYQLTQFVNQLENLHRAYLVTQLNVQPGDPLAHDAASAAAAAGTPGYSGALTAKVDGFVFEVLSQAPAGTTTTLPSSSSGH
jgi:Tfp pilus assembly protein PilO